MNGALTAGVQWPAVAYQSTTEHDVHAVGTPVGNDANARNLATDADLDGAIFRARFSRQRRAVDGEGRARTGSDVRASVVPEEHERRQSSEHRIECVTPDAA